MRFIPDGYALIKLEAIEYLADQWPGAYRKFYAIAVDSSPAAPTVKAEQVPTPEFVWVRLLEALAGDNGCPFTASTDDYREAKPALVQLIAAGLFRDDADSLDGDIWTIAAGEQSEAAARFASCADAYAVLSDVLNRVFERPDEAPSLPAAGSVDVKPTAWLCPDGEVLLESDFKWNPGRTRDGATPLYAVLSAQQSAQPEFCCELSYKVVKQAAWGARDLTQCKCDHNEYCEHCWPDDFREGGKWHGGFETKQSAPEPVMEQTGKVLVSAEPLRQVLNALVNAPHMIRELQATREPVALFADNPINVLIAEFNAAHGGE